MTGGGGPNIASNEGMEAFLHIVQPGAIAFCLFVMYITMWIFEATLHWLRERLKPHKHLTMLLHRSTDELMILGLTSLILFIVQLSAGNSGIMDQLTFELLHITLFLSVVLFLLFTALMVFASRIVVIRKWQELETHHKKYGYEGTSSPNGMSHYLLLKRSFIAWHGLNQDFLFSVYLKDCLFSLIKEVIDFDAKMWMVAYVFILPLSVSAYFMYLIYFLVLVVYMTCFVKTVRIRYHIDMAVMALEEADTKNQESCDWQYFQDQPPSAFSIMWEIQLRNHVPEAALHWFGCPRLIRWVLHFTLLSMAITLAVTAVFFRGTLPWYTIIIVFVLFFLGVLAVPVFILPVLAETMSIGRMADEVLLSKCTKGVKLNVLEQPTRPRGFTEAILRARIPEPAHVRRKSRIDSMDKGYGHPHHHSNNNGIASLSSSINNNSTSITTPLQQTLNNNNNNNNDDADSIDDGPPPPPPPLPPSSPSSKGSKATNNSTPTLERGMWGFQESLDTRPDVLKTISEEC